MLAQTNALEYVNIYASVLFLTSTPKPLHIIYTKKNNNVVNKYRRYLYFVSC